MNKFDNQKFDNTSAGRPQRVFSGEPVYEPPSTAEYLKLLGICVMGLVVLGVVIYVVFNYLAV